MENKTRKPRFYWNYEKCKEEALKYKTRKELQINNQRVYDVIWKNKWEELFSHMVILGNKYKRLIYVYEFSDNTCYIGLTFNISIRNKQHLNRSDSSVYKHIDETGLSPNLVIKSNYIDVKEAILLEGKIEQEYKNNGWNVLNSKKTGGVGSNQIIWTKEKCLLEALKYKRLVDFQKLSGSAYRACLRNKWIDDIPNIERQKTINGYWNNYELCKTESRKFKYRKELHKNNWAAYNYANKNGWLEDFYPKNIKLV